MGFTYSDIVSVPLEEFYAYIEIAQNYNSNQAQAAQGLPIENTPHPIGEVIPNLKPIK